MKKRNLLCLIALAVMMIFLPVNSYSGLGVIDLPKTGQTTSYYPGDDGNLETGIGWPSPRFTANPDGTVTDNLTGLVWLKDANCALTSGYDANGALDGQVLWANGLDFVYQINNGYDISACGYTGSDTDWRVPNINELESLVHSGYMEAGNCGDPAGCATLTEWLNYEGFTNVQSAGNPSGGVDANGAYWVTTSYISAALDAWAIEMSDGDSRYTDSDLGNTKDNILLFVWPVRGDSDGSTAPGCATNNCVGIPQTAGNDATDNDPTTYKYCSRPGWVWDNTCNVGNWYLIAQQDRYLKKGVAWPTTGNTPSLRFVNVGDGTMIDLLTGLQWLQDVTCMVTQYPGFDNDNTPGDGRVTWQRALDFVAGINDGTYPNCAAGYTDWRLPNRKEQISIFKWYGEPGSFGYWLEEFLGREGFQNVGFGYAVPPTPQLWTSTSFDANNAIRQQLFRGDLWAQDKTRDRGVWPVRTPVPDISSDPASFDFGPVNVGATSAPQTFTISNDGNNDLDIETLSITGADASDFSIVALSDNCSNTTVTPTNSCTVDVECSPTSFGAKSADLSIPSNDPDENPLLVGLDCTGLGPDISASPGSFNCGAMNLGNTTAVPFTVSNDGNADLNIGAISVTGDTGEFTWDFSNCSGQTVGAGNSCIIDAECAPVTEGGPWCIDISIPSNDPDENPLVIDVCETGVLGAAPDLIVSDLSIPKVKKNRRGHIAKIFVDYKVMNQGTGDSVPSKLGVYLSRDTVLDAGDTYIGSANIPSLAPGEETPRLLRAKRFKLRPPVFSSGTWYVLGKADDNDDNTELDENNNVTPTLITGSGR